jgi:DNA-binding transcriptional ArsR family regulator
MQRTLEHIEYDQTELDLAEIAKALSHPVRIRILKLLAEQACCFTVELTDILPMSQPTISQHLKVLKEAGLIHGEIQPPKIRYCIDREAMKRGLRLMIDLLG